ncbi:MAG TPA: hypothetical protein VFZ52_05160 [Chryseolinea sp.]
MFSRKRNCIPSLAKVLLAIFLFTFTASQVLLLSEGNLREQGFVVSKSKTTSPAAQSPFEKTELDEKYAEEKSTNFLSIVESLFTTPADDELHLVSTDRSAWSNSSNTPLYLFIRKLLI